MKSIAVVEDNADNQLLISILLEDQYRLFSYESGPDALQGIRDQKPDLILLDISLPEMDGLQVVAHIRSDEGLCHIPVLALTAHTMRGDRERFLAAGFDDYLTKPILDEGALLSTIERWLTAPGAHRAVETRKRDSDGR